jgi:hypothetical protein
MQQANKVAQAQAQAPAAVMATPLQTTTMAMMGLEI